jgi:hypothetical protein
LVIFVILIYFLLGIEYNYEGGGVAELVEPPPVVLKVRGSNLGAY